jgi:sterol desaturase/sphingolipid hydroxylase (fatty acid hydroxylase superfamily)
MQLVQRYLVVMLATASLLAYVAALQTGAPVDLVVSIASALTLAVAWLLERRLPWRADWQRSRGDVATDLASAGVIVGVADPLLKTLAPMVVVALHAGLGSWAPALDLPLWIEIPALLLMIEFGKYWAHRLHHALPPLWWLHAMHHSSERLYALNGLRFHPLNHALNFAMAVLPAMALGFSPTAILGYLAITQPIVLLQHANIDLRHGWLNRIFSTPEVHRWHHATRPQDANRNFGNALLLWDHVFGTFRPAEGFGRATRIGLFAASKASYPASAGYLAQLASMFKPPCCRA